MLVACRLILLGILLSISPLLQGQELIAIYQAADGAISDNYHLALVSNAAEGEPVVTLYRDLTEDLMEDEQFELKVPNKYIPRKIYTDRDANTIIVLLSNVIFSQIFGEEGLLLIYRRVEGSWLETYRRQVPMTVWNYDYGPTDVDFVHNTSDLLVISSAVLSEPSSVGRDIESLLLAFDYESARHIVVDSARAKVEASSSISQTFVGKTLWIGFSSWSNPYSHITYDLSASSLASREIVLPREDLQHGCSISVAAPASHFGMISKEYYLSPVERKFTLLTNWQHGDSWQSIDQQEMALEQFGVTGMAISTCGKFAGISVMKYNASIFGEDTLDYANYYMVEKGSLQLLHQFGSFYADSLHFGGTGRLELSKNGRYVLMSSPDGQKSWLYDMSGVIPESCRSAKEHQTVLYPNPVADDVLYIADAHYDMTAYRLYDCRNRLIEASSYTGNGRITLPPTLTSGLYFLVIAYGDGSER